LALNAVAAIYVSGKAKDMLEGVMIAQEMLKSGAAKEKLTQLIKFTRNF